MLAIPKLYIATPEVFEPDPIAVGECLKEIVRCYGFEPLFPMDNTVPAGDPNPSLSIFRGNTAMIRQADIVVANLNPFRGAEPDSGTVWEAGFALGLGKRVVGHMRNGEPMAARVLSLEGQAPRLLGPFTDDAGRSIEDFGHPLNLMLMHSLDQLVIGEFEDALDYLAYRAPAALGTSVNG